MATIPTAIKVFIIEHLACYDTPTQVAADVKAEFGVVVSRQAVERYDPTKLAGSSLSPKWKALFDTARKRFQDETGDIPIANKAVRLRRLERIYTGAGANKVLQMDALERAAKEVGDAYTNTRNVKVSDPKGDPISVSVVIEQSKPAHGTATT